MRRTLADWLVILAVTEAVSERATSNNPFDLLGMNWSTHLFPHSIVFDGTAVGARLVFSALDGRVFSSCVYRTSSEARLRTF